MLGNADRQVMLRLLREGSCVGTMPEGLAGIFSGATEHEERICVSQHKGYIRVALQAGAGVLCTHPYSLGLVRHVHSLRVLLCLMITTFASYMPVCSMLPASVMLSLTCWGWSLGTGMVHMQSHDQELLQNQ